MNRKTNLKMLVLIWVVVVARAGAMWDITAVYGHAQPDYPSDGAVISGDIAVENIWTKLIFIPDASAVKHTGYFSDDYSDVAGRIQDANLGEPPYGHIQGWEYTYFAGNPQVPPAVETLVRGTKYYWTVDETNALGNTLAGDVWEFTIQDFKASFPNPHNEAIFVEADLLLSWLPGFGVEDHDVYLGTDLNSVELAEFDFTFPPPEFLGTILEPNIFVTELASDTKYYWRVDQVNGRVPPLFLPGESYKSDVWGFTTVPEGVGTIREDLWWNIAGDAVSDLINDPRYPGNPDETRILTSFNSGVALGNDYGGQIHGWLHPVKSGNYTFWLCSDDSSELFLSTDHTPANKVRIAYINGWANPFDWYNQSGTHNPFQQSAPIPLVGGRKYYIMARWKEDFAGDHCMVAWQGPDQPQAPVYGSSFAVIKGNRLSPYAQLWAHDPEPSDGQVNVVSPVTLSWGPGDYATEHDVYISTDKALVENRTPSVYKGRIDSNSYNLGTVFSGMIYYWAIDEVSNFGPSPGIWQGDVWSFTTKPAPIFVDDDATGANDGSSWADAYNSLQDGLARADSSVKPVEIRVAQGIYKPTLPPPPPPPWPPPPPLQAVWNNSQVAEASLADREVSFQLLNGVSIKGGYAGFSGLDPNARDIELYETILSGDLSGNDVEVTDQCDLLMEPTRSENAYHVITGTGTDSTAVLDGFTIIGGNANPGSAQGYSELTNMELIPPLPFDSRKWGGGLYNHQGNPTLIACTFCNNSSQYGGAGMYNRYNSSPMLINCLFIGNSAGWNGGGIRNSGSSNPILTECTFIRNSASGGGGMGNEESNPALANCTFIGGSARNEGGGLYNYHSSPTLTNCTFSQNEADWSGGAMGNSSFSNPVLTNCTFSGNSAIKDGGGIYSNYGNSVRLTRCTLTGNSAGELGGGMYTYGGEAMLTNCMLSENSATWCGGIYNDSYNTSTLANCTITNNRTDGGGGGICSRGANTTVTNCILWDDTADEGNEIALFTHKFCYSEACSFRPSLFTVIYSDVQGGPDGVYIDPNSTLSWGSSNIDSDPLFIEPGYWDANGTPDDVNDDVWVDGDYHLLGGSPCIDAGDPCCVPEPNEMDLDGRPRVIGDRIDMGAYEFFNTPPVAVAGDNQIVECACNTAEGTKVTLDGSGSYDVDGDAITYKWMGPFAESPVDGVAPTVTLEDGCPGEYVIALVVNDGTEDSEPNEIVITVVDTTPPEFTFSVIPTMLWPPNKKMVMITPSWTVSDKCDATSDVSLVSVSINESETRSQGNTDDDIQIDQDGTIYVRAKRNRTGDRIYTITYQAVDDSGNATVRSATVTVPRKRR